MPIVALRAARLLFHIFQAILIACIFPGLDAPAQRRIVQRWSLGLMNILNVRWNADSRQPLPAIHGCLFVANHISWLDVFAMNAAFPAHFIAKSEVCTWPLVGWLSRRTGALFIRRETLRDTARVNRQIAGMLQLGECIALFPEGTSTDGSQPVNFNPALLQGAIDAGAVIHPVAVRYHDGSGQRLDDAAFIGDMTFMQSLWKILRSASLHVTVAYLPAVHEAGNNRRMLAQAAQDAVNSHLGGPAGDRFMPEVLANDATINQLLISPSCCGNITQLNSFPGYLGDDDAEPDPAATPAT